MQIAFETKIHYIKIIHKKPKDAHFNTDILDAVSSNKWTSAVKAIANQIVLYLLHTMEIPFLVL